MTFEELLNRKFMEDNPMVLDDDLPDAYDNWIAEQDPVDIAEWAQIWCDVKVGSITEALKAITAKD